MSLFSRKVIAIKSSPVNEIFSSLDTTYVSPNSPNASVISACELKTKSKTFLALAEIYTLVSLAQFAKFVSNLDLAEYDKIQILRFARNPFSLEKFSEFINHFNDFESDCRNKTIEFYKNLVLLPSNEKVKAHVYVELINGDTSTISIETSPASVSHIYEDVPDSPSHIYEDLSAILDKMNPPVLLTSTPIKKLKFSSPIDVINTDNTFDFNESLGDSSFLKVFSFVQENQNSKPISSDIPQLTRELKQKIREMFASPNKVVEKQTLLGDLKKNANGQAIVAYLLENNRRLFLGHSKFKEELKQLNFSQISSVLKTSDGLY